MAIPHIEPAPGNVHWGFFEAGLPPLLTIASGERVTLSTVSGTRDMMPAPPLVVPPALAAIQAGSGRKMLPGHICTGPVAVDGAEPGHVLQVDIEAIEPYYDWGYTHVRPLLGALPHDFAELRVIHSVLDRAPGHGACPGARRAVRSVFGVMGWRRPPPGDDLHAAAAPQRRQSRQQGLIAGTTLYLPISPPARCSAGDGHGAQGDRRGRVNAVETRPTGTFRLTVRRDMELQWPLAETATHMMTMAFDPDLDDCVVIALRQMIDLIGARAGLDRYQAYMLCSLAADLRVTQVVNGNKGIHVMLDKRYFARP